MRGAIKATLKALYEGKEVNATNGLNFGTTRTSNEIVALRHTLGIDIDTVRVNTSNRKWYGKYVLVRSEKNLEKVRVILGIDSQEDEVQKC